MTGRGAGYCAGYELPGYGNPVPGRGFGMGRGWARGAGWRGRGGGRGWRHWFYATGLPGWARFGYTPAWEAPPLEYGPYYAAPPTQEQEGESLKAQAKFLQEQLQAISQRLSELESNE